jgi:hypothetical protein
MPPQCQVGFLLKNRCLLISCEVFEVFGLFHIRNVVSGMARNFTSNVQAMGNGEKEGVVEVTRSGEK